MPKFRIFYTITDAGSDYVEAETLEKAIEKWEQNPPSYDVYGGGVVEYDPYNEEYFSESEKES
jgi:hypothetical protein